MPLPPPPHGVPSRSQSPRPRPRPRPSEQVRVIRELWLLREQARVQAAERHFLNELQRVLHRALAGISERNAQESRQTNQSHTLDHAGATDDETSHNAHAETFVPHAPPPPPPHLSATEYPLIGDTVDVLPDGITYESNPPPRNDETGPARERPGVTYAEVQAVREQQHVTVRCGESHVRASEAMPWRQSLARALATCVLTICAANILGDRGDATDATGLCGYVRTRVRVEPEPGVPRYPGGERARERRADTARADTIMGRAGAPARGQQCARVCIPTRA